MKTKPLALLTLGLLPSFFTPANADLKDGLVAHWSFDDCRATDNSGNGHDGTLNGNPQCVDGVKGKAFSFSNGTHINAIADSSFSSKTITLSAWINPLGAGDHSPRIIAVGAIGSSNHYYSLTLENSSNNRRVLLPAYSDNGDHYLFSNQKISDNSGWYHVVTIINETQSAIYINGKLDSQTNNFSLLPLFKDGMVQIGYSDNSYDQFIGGIDETRIYNRALTEAEVLELYNGGGVVSTDKPVLVADTGNNGVCSKTAVAQISSDWTFNPNSSALPTCSNVPIYDPKALPKIVDMTKAECRYVAPIYTKTAQEMKVKNAPSCKAVQNYFTWKNFTRADNQIVASIYSDRVNGLEASNNLFNARMAKIDEGISLVNDLLDLKNVLKPRTYQLTANIMKPKGILKSLAAGKTPFDRRSVMGKVFDKTLKEKLIIDNAKDPFCDLFFDGAVAKSCSNEAGKIASCASGLATEGWKGASGCVTGGVTSAIGFVNTSLNIFNAVDLKQHIIGYRLIDDYLDNYFANSNTQVPNDDQLETDIQMMTEKDGLSYSWFDLEIDDYDLEFVKTGIKESLARNKTKAAKDLALIESLRKMLPKNL